MKTKNYFIASILFVSVLFSTTILAQEKYSMVELQFIMPKIGMESAFESAVKAHNNLYHKDAPYKASVDVILTGKQSGWYVWIMGPCMFTDLDSRPVSDAHDKDWSEKVAPKIAKYGAVEYWRHNSELSYKSGTEDAKLEEIWFLDIKRGDNYKFKAFIAKIKAAFEKRGEGDMQVYYNQFNEDDGRDVAIVWGMKNWTEMDKDDDGIKKYYEEINGEGSWTNAMDDWEEIVQSMKSQLWKIGI